MHNFLLVKRWKMFVCYYTVHGGWERSPQLISTETWNPFTEVWSWSSLHKRWKFTQQKCTAWDETNNKVSSFSFSRGKWSSSRDSLVVITSNLNAFTRRVINKEINFPSQPGTLLSAPEEIPMEYVSPTLTCIQEQREYVMQRRRISGAAFVVQNVPPLKKGQKLHALRRAINCELFLSQQLNKNCIEQHFKMHLKTLRIGQKSEWKRNEHWTVT